MSKLTEKKERNFAKSTVKTNQQTKMYHKYYRQNKKNKTKHINFSVNINMYWLPLSQYKWSSNCIKNKTQDWKQRDEQRQKVNKRKASVDSNMRKWEFKVKKITEQRVVIDNDKRHNPLRIKTVINLYAPNQNPYI